MIRKFVYFVGVVTISGMIRDVWRETLKQSAARLAAAALAQKEKAGTEADPLVGYPVE